MLFLTSQDTYLSQLEWLETGCADLHRYIDLLVGVENVARDEARVYNQERGASTITCVGNMRALPDGFRQQLALRLSATFSVKVTGDYLYSVETLENLCAAIFSAHERIRFDERLQSCARN